MKYIVFRELHTSAERGDASSVERQMLADIVKKRISGFFRVMPFLSI
jgi:hypothetical protein